MNLQIATIQDCMDMYHMKDMSVVVHDGRVCGFIEKNETEQEIEYPCQTAKSEQG